MANIGEIKTVRFKNRVTFGNKEPKELPNGRDIYSFVPKFTVKAADYRLSDRMFANLNGDDIQRTKVIAIRHRNNVDYGDYIALYKGKEYSVTYVLEDSSKIRSYDLVTLKVVHKDGG